MKTARNKYRARRIIVVYVCSILLLQGLFSVIVPWWHPDAEFRVHRDALQALMTEHPDRPFLVMVGSSRVSFGFDPDYLSPIVDDKGTPVECFNFGHFNAGPTANLLTVDRLLRAKIKPRWLIVEVLPSLCFQEWSGFVHASTWGDVKTLSRYYSLGKFAGSLLTNHLLLPWFEHRGELQERYLHETQEERRDLLISKRGWWTSVPDAVDSAYRQQLTENQRIVFGVDLSGRFHIAPECAAALRDLLARCRTEGINVALLLMPEGETFRSWYTPAAEAEFDSLLGQLVAEHQVPIFDTREWFDDSYFADSHHLLRPGARKFTLRLEREFLRPFVAGDLPMQRQFRDPRSIAQGR
jgi:hypothetical protein